MKRTVLITGASSGIGQACAQKFAAQGDRLILVARRLTKLQELAIDLPTEVHTVAVDITRIDEFLKAIDELPTDFQKIDILINNAGVTLGSGPISERKLTDWYQMVDTNIKGTIGCSQIVLKKMVQENSGHIINIGSTAGQYPRPGDPVYCASKSFTRQFALALRADLIGTRIRVTSIEPATVADTELALGRLNGDRQKLTDMFKDYQYLKPEDIAESIHWATSVPEHVNVNALELMATCQAFSNLTSHK